MGRGRKEREEEGRGRQAQTGMNSLHQAALQRSLERSGRLLAAGAKDWILKGLCRKRMDPLGSYRPASVLPNPSRGIKFLAGEGGREATPQLDTRCIHILQQHFNNVF